MTEPDPADAKAVLHHYLRTSRDALLWKLDGVSEYDARRPLTPTGTNLLGLVKHVGSVASGYFGEVFERPFPEAVPWLAGDAAEGADMWAAAEESRADIVGFYRRVWKHADTTVDALSLDAVGRVPWWPGERGRVTLQLIMVHMLAELNRHAGHADIVRELVDGSAGLGSRSSGVPEHDEQWWADYRGQLEAAARAAS